MSDKFTQLIFDTPVSNGKELPSPDGSLRKAIRKDRKPKDDTKK